MGSLVILGLILLAAWCFCSGGSSPRPAVGHFHGGSRARVVQHEAGHVVAARAVGGRVKSAEVYRGGGGLVTWTGVGGSERDQVVANIAFLRAGRYAAGD